MGVKKLFQANPSHPATDVQQISFSCESLEDIVGYYERFKAHGVRFNHEILRFVEQDVRSPIG